MKILWYYGNIAMTLPAKKWIWWVDVDQKLVEFSSSKKHAHIYKALMINIWKPCFWYLISLKPWYETYMIYVHTYLHAKHITLLALFSSAWEMHTICILPKRVESDFRLRVSKPFDWRHRYIFYPIVWVGIFVSYCLQKVLTNNSWEKLLNCMSQMMKLNLACTFYGKRRILGGERTQTV